LKSAEKFISFDDYGINYERADSLYSKVNDSVVLLRVYNRDETEYGTASGIIVSDDGYIISCAHIYDDIANPVFKVVTQTGKTYQATFVAGDVESDLCLLKIIKTEDRFTPVKFTNSSLVDAGDRAYILGFPGGGTVEPVITAGIISHPDVRITATNGYEISCIQTDTTANPGHSGGGLFDSMGHVIGLVSAKYVNNMYENTIYCVPSTTIAKVINNLYYNGYIARPTFGITFRDVSNVEMDNGVPYGGKLVEISETSPLHGLVTTGEVITAVNGNDITLAYDFYDAIQDITTQNPHVTLKIYNVETKEYRNVDIVVTFRIGENGYKVGNFETIVPEETPTDTPEDVPVPDNNIESDTE
jgi:serine protease Do